MNYFEYFSEIEQRFVARRGSLLLLSTLDWALIETWREAGVPLAAVLRGIDTAFDRYEARRGKAKGRLAKVNGLAWCAQAVMEAAVAMTEAAVGGRSAEPGSTRWGSGLEADRVRRFLSANAAALETAQAEAHAATPEWRQTLVTTAARLRELAAEAENGGPPALDDLDRALTVLEDRLQATLLASVPERELLAAREAADREMAPVRQKLGAGQLRQLRDQIVQKHLLGAYRLPRLSLFYMPLGEEADEPPAAEAQP